MGVVAFVISVKRDERQKEEEHLFRGTRSLFPTLKGTVIGLKKTD